VFKAYRNHPHYRRIFGKALSQATLGRWLGLEQSQVSKIENAPKPEENTRVIESYAEALRIPRRHLWIVPAGETLSTFHGKLQQDNGYVHVGELIIPASERELVVALDASLENERELLAEIRNGRHRTDLSAIDAVASVVGNLRRLEDLTSATAVIPSVISQGALATALANNATGDIRTTAVGLLSEIHQYLGWLHMPNKNWGMAQSHLDRATILAMEANDPQRLSTALSFMSYKNLRRDNLSAAASLNEAASRDPRTSIGQRTYLAFQRAEVLARHGYRTESSAALREAEGLESQLPSEDELPDAGYWYTPGFFHGFRAFVLHAMGDTTQAKHVASEAMEMLPAKWKDSEWASRRRKLAELD
jgi:tetratricopeptide (TPR) repeat protein/DNA-binding XRE family transcriptional regulator